MRVKMADTTREPRQPMRLEKKRNTWIDSLCITRLTGLDGAGQYNLLDRRERR